MGRADQATKVRGMFVHPRQVADVLQRHAEISRARLVVRQDDGRDAMVLRCEVDQPNDGLAAAVGNSMRALTQLRADIELVPPGTLPNDGRVIEDERPVPQV
jgi:phenylacetate-CoA ligase